MDQPEWGYGARMSRDRRAAEAWPTREPEVAEPEPRWASLADTGSMAPSEEALTWQRRADAWAQQAEVEPYGGGQAIEPANRWSEVAATGRPTFPADGVGWRTQTSEWRATGARWRQTTEWRSSTGSHVWRSTTEAWQGDEERGTPEREKPAITGTAWPTPDADSGNSDIRGASDTPSWRQSSDQAPSWQQSSATPSWQQQSQQTPSWQQSRQPEEETPSWRRPEEPGRATRPVEQTWSGAGSATPSWQQPSTPTPSWQQRPADSWSGDQPTSSWSRGSEQSAPSWERGGEQPADAWGGNREQPSDSWRSGGGPDQPADAWRSGNRASDQPSDPWRSGGNGRAPEQPADVWRAENRALEAPSDSWRTSTNSRGPEQPADAWRTSGTGRGPDQPADAWGGSRGTGRDPAADRAATDRAATDSWRTGGTGRGSDQPADAWGRADNGRGGRGDSDRGYRTGGFASGGLGNDRGRDVGENTTGMARWERTDAPGWQTSPADDARHLVREDDRAAWRRDAAYEDPAPRRGRRRAPESDATPSGGSGWSSTGSDSDNWARHTDTGNIQMFADSAPGSPGPQGQTWGGRGDAPQAQTWGGPDQGQTRGDSGPQDQTWGSRGEAPDTGPRRSRRAEQQGQPPAAPQQAQPPAGSKQAQPPAAPPRRGRPARYNANATDWREDTSSWAAEPDTSNWTRDPDTGQWSRAEDDPRVLAWRAEAARREAMKDDEPDGPDDGPDGPDGRGGAGPGNNGRGGAGGIGPGGIGSNGRGGAAASVSAPAAFGGPDTGSIPGGSRSRRSRREEPTGGVPGGPLPSSGMPGGSWPTSAVPNGGPPPGARNEPMPPASRTDSMPPAQRGEMPPGPRNDAMMPAPRSAAPSSTQTSIGVPSTRPRSAMPGAIRPSNSTPGGISPPGAQPPGATSWNSAAAMPYDEDRPGGRRFRDEPDPYGYDAEATGGRRRASEPPRRDDPSARRDEPPFRGDEPLSPEAWRTEQDPRQSRQYRRLNVEPDEYPADNWRQGPMPPRQEPPRDFEPRRELPPGRGYGEVRPMRELPSAEPPRWNGGSARELPAGGQPGWSDSRRGPSTGSQWDDSGRPDPRAYGARDPDPRGYGAPREPEPRAYGAARELPAGGPSWQQDPPPRRELPAGPTPRQGQSWPDPLSQPRRASAPAYGSADPDGGRGSYGNTETNGGRVGYGNAEPNSGRGGYGNTEPNGGRGGYDNDDWNGPSTGGGGYGQARPPAGDWLAAERASSRRAGAQYRESAGQAGENDWRQELNRDNEPIEGEPRRYDTSDFPPFRPSGAAAVAGASNLALSSTSVITRPTDIAPAADPAVEEDTTWPPRRAGAAVPAGDEDTSWPPRRPADIDPAGDDDTSWPPRRPTGAFQGTGSYERRPVSDGMLASANSDLLDPDDTEENEQTSGGPLAAVGYTVVWYGVPVILFVAGMFLLNSGQRSHALDTLADAAPEFGISLALSMLVALGLRFATTAWKSASVGLAAAVVGGGLATVLSSAITGNSLS